MTAIQRVSALRALMAAQGYHAFLIPSEDAHMSEYVAACDERRPFLTSFTGSAGVALVTADAAYCWTDGRYFVQAAKQLDPSVFTLMRILEDPPVEEWIVANLPHLSVVGVDGRTISVSSMKRYRHALAASTKRRITISCLPHDVPNLVDQVWSVARPAIPAAPVAVHPDKYAGRSVQDKIASVRSVMTERGATMLIVTALDEVAWFLNLRGSDVDFNPVFWAFVTVTLSNVTLYINDTRFSKGVAEHLSENSVQVRPYDALYSDLADYTWNDGDRLWIDPSVCNYAIVQSVEQSKGNVQSIRKQGPIVIAKARKNEVELEGVRNCHLRDAVAMCKFLCWVEKQVDNNVDVDEVSAADKLDGLRSEQDLFVSLSFPTISSAGSNGAIIHYRPEKKTCAPLTKNDMYVLDSGGQYRDGTTDVTRTIHFGEPSDWHRECFTRVLKGHIAIDTAVFPKGTTGHLLDGFARRSLWSIGLDYKHGTGHGVGSYLNVHEGPHMISFKAQALETALEVGFLTSNEPGYYEEGGFGVRIENVCIITEAQVNGPPKGTSKPFMKMERVTMVPLQQKLIDVKMLSREERDWVNEYHREVLGKLEPMLQDDEETLGWLKKSVATLADSEL